jgi:hypothetical protein
MAEQIRVIYSLAEHGAPNEHPQVVMQRLADELHFTILGAVPQSICDQWWFWIEFDRKPDFPEFITEARWLPVGRV